MIHVTGTIQQHGYVQITINKPYYDPQGTVGLHGLGTVVRSLTLKQSYTEFNNNTEMTAL
jgi:hypothetical protein